MTFGSFRLTGFKGRADGSLLQEAVETAQEFASKPSGWLVLEGASGSGKTHLAAAIVNSLVDRGAPAKYLSALDIPDLLQAERF